MGVCVQFLSLVHVSSLRVATALLLLALCYDVFFVFFSSFLFGNSVMSSVVSSNSYSTSVVSSSATSYGLSTYNTDENYCEKYPTESVCTTTSILPMMLAAPSSTIFSALPSTNAPSGLSLLGLGIDMIKKRVVDLMFEYKVCFNF